MKSVRLEPEAKQELAAAAAWYEERRQGLGVELLAEVDTLFTAIVRNPSRYPFYPRVVAQTSVSVGRLLGAFLTRLRSSNFQA